MADLNFQFVSALPGYTFSGGITIDNNGVMWASCYEGDALYNHVYKATPPEYIFTAFTAISAANINLGGICTRANNDKWIAPWLAAPIIINGTTEGITTFGGSSPGNRHDICVDASDNLWITCLSNGLWKKAPADANFSQILTHPAAYPNAPYGLTGARYNPVDGYLYVGVYSSPSSNGGTVLKVNPSSPSWVSTGAPNVSMFDTFCSYSGDVYCSGTGLSASVYKLTYGGGWSTSTINTPLFSNRAPFSGWFTADDAVMFVTSGENLYKTSVPPNPPVAISAIPSIMKNTVTWTGPA